ncbi:hypothetical protein HA466_0069780 [Hirschfeldia incana]|nr:hypothetical protein HA466_0069780 [Hirschfeldia incana]
MEEEQGGGLLEELHLECTSNEVHLERKLLTSNTLVKLTLSREYSLEVDPVFLPALKSLSLLTVGGLAYHNYRRLIKGCPVLEELFVTDIAADAADPYPPCCTTSVESPSIKRLVVSVDIHQVLLNLKLWGDHHNPGIYGDVTNLAAGISNITTLHLSPDSLEAFHFCCKSMPVFKNLINLSIESNKKKGWQVMPLLLNSCPNLHTLVFKGLVHKVTDKCGDACACTPKKKKKKKSKVVSRLKTCQVKVLEILEYGGSFQELKQMRHFLGKLECLETVRVGGIDAADNNIFLRANLLALPIVSSNCNNVHFI